LRDGKGCPDTDTNEHNHKPSGIDETSTHGASGFKQMGLTAIERATVSGPRFVATQLPTLTHRLEGQVSDGVRPIERFFYTEDYGDRAAVPAAARCTHRQVVDVVAVEVRDDPLRESPVGAGERRDDRDTPTSEPPYRSTRAGHESAR
jgi:hypothetical protein